MNSSSVASREGFTPSFSQAWRIISSMKASFAGDRSAGAASWADAAADTSTSTPRHPKNAKATIRFAQRRFPDPNRLDLIVVLPRIGPRTLGPDAVGNRLALAAN